MNQLQITFMARQQVKIVPDKRYRIMVTLMRADRPRYWNFKCFHCGSKVCELVNRDVYDVVDFFDPNNPDNNGTMKHCKGTQPDGLPCPYSYFFNMQ